MCRAGYDLFDCCLIEGLDKVLFFLKDQLKQLDIPYDFFDNKPNLRPVQGGKAAVL